MAVTLNKANLVLKDANGNIGKIEQLSSNDLAKIKTAVSDVALVVNQSNHTPIEATTTNKGVVQLATPADVVSGASDKVVTAEQLHNATTGTSALATENLARIDAVVTEAGIPIDHTNTNQLKTAVTTLVNNAVPSTATSTTLGVVKPDNDTITIDSNGVLTATKATQDSAGNVITDTYVKKTGNETISGVKTFTGTINASNFIGFHATQDGIGGGIANYLNNNRVCDVIGQPNGADKSSLIHLRIKDYGTDDNLAYLVIGGNNKTKQGSITFNGKNLVRSVNGVNADVNGNVKLGLGVYLVQSWVSGVSWYRVWSDGWCEQGSRSDVSHGFNTITLLKAFRDNQYNVLLTRHDSNVDNDMMHGFLSGTFNTSNFIVNCEGSNHNSTITWRAYGYVTL